MLRNFKLNPTRALILTLTIGGICGMLYFARFAFVDCSRFVEYAMVSDEFVTQVWPPPNSKIPMKCYLRDSENIVFHVGEGVGATIVTVRVDEFWQTPPIEPMEKRIKIFIDGKEFNEKPNTIHMQELIYCDESDICIETGRPAAINVFWKPFLLVGQHTITIQVKNDLDEIQEYSWEFSITW